MYKNILTRTAEHTTWREAEQWIWATNLRPLHIDCHLFDEVLLTVKLGFEK